MRNFIYLLSICLLVALSCKKEEVVPIQPANSPIFRSMVYIGEDSSTFIAGEQGVLVSNTSTENGVYRINALFINDDNSLSFTLNDGKIGDKTPLIQKLMSQSKLQVTSFSPLSYTYPLDTLKKLLGGAVDLYINEQKLITDNYVFSSPGIYTLKVVKNYEGQTYTISNDWYVGYENPYGNLSFAYDAGSHKMVADISGGFIPKTAVKWYLDGELIGEGLKLMKNLNDQGLKKLTAVVIFNGEEKKFESLIDFNQGGVNQVYDVKQYDYLLQDNQWQDFRFTLKVKLNGKEWEVIPGTTADLKIDALSYYKNIGGKDIYLLETNGMSLKFRNIETGEIRQGKIIFKGGLEFPY